MVARAATEEVEFAGFVHDDDDNDGDVMGEDEHAASGGSGGGRAAHVLPFPHILYGANPSAVRSLGGGPSDAAAQRGHFQSLYDAAASSGDLPHGPQRSIEGWIVLVTGVEEDAEENDLYNAFSEFGQVKNLHFNLGRRTGYAMGYVLIEYESFEEAQTAIGALNGTTLLTKTVYVDWAFSKGPLKQLCGTRPSRQRSRTPPRRLAALTTC